MLVPTLLALVLAASQVFASPTPQGASTNGLLEKKNVHYGGCTKKLLRRPWYDILSIPSNRYISAANCVKAQTVQSRENRIPQRRIVSDEAPKQDEASRRTF